MLQALKRTMNTIEEKFNGMITPDPLQRQEGGEHYKGMKIQPVEFIHANGIPYLAWRNAGHLDTVVPHNAASTLHNDQVDLEDRLKGFNASYHCLPKILHV